MLFNEVNIHSFSTQTQQTNLSPAKVKVVHSFYSSFYCVVEKENKATMNLSIFFNTDICILKATVMS